MTALTAVYRAELAKIVRRRTVLATAVVVLLGAAVATTVVHAAAGPAAEAQGPRPIPTLEGLAESGGGTEAFSVAMGFGGFFAFVVFIANWASEFSQGTFRTMLLKQPRRLTLLAGKMVGLLTFAMGALLLALAATWASSLVAAAMRDVSTEAWFSVSALTAGAGDYATAVLTVVGWASFGMALALLVRSVPLALGIGIGWAGPFEHLTQEAWGALAGWYPGLLLEALAAGGTQDVAYGRALGLLAAYVAVAVVAAGVTFRRRDIAG